MLLAIHPDNPDSRKIKQVADVLVKGGVVIMPTDTIYALVCSINQYKAFESICRIKGIKPEKANFSLICSDLSNISNYTKSFDRGIYKLLNRALPGAYTFILEASSEVPSVFRSKKKTIGLRIPDNKIMLDLVQAIGHPVVATSLHDLDKIIEYPTDPYEIHEQFESVVDLVVDGGYGKNIASTVIDCTSGEAVIIREGAGDVSVVG